MGQFQGTSPALRVHAANTEAFLASCMSNHAFLPFVLVFCVQLHPAYVGVGDFVFSAVPNWEFHTLGSRMQHPVALKRSAAGGLV
jgi:hypothetical protein